MMRWKNMNDAARIERLRWFSMWDGILILMNAITLLLLYLELVNAGVI